MHVEVEAWSRDRHADEDNRVTPVFIFVAVGPDRQPRAVTPLVAI